MTWANVPASTVPYNPTETLRFSSLSLHQGISRSLGQPYVVGVEYECAVVLRSTGAFLLIKGGAYATWTLIYVVDSGGLGTLYPTFAGLNPAGTTLDNARVADLGGPWLTDWGIALNRSTFTAANGTALTAITPEVGGGWTAHNGTWTITGNKLNGVPNSSRASVESGAANVVVEATFRHAGTIGSGILIRYVDANNHWFVYLTGTIMEIYEMAGGVLTQRASATVSQPSATDLRAVVIADGASIRTYLNNVAGPAYASAASGLTATRHGVYNDNIATTTIDDFIVWPRNPALPSGV